jgi:hypothetical protein
MNVYFIDDNTKCAYIAGKTPEHSVTLLSTAEGILPRYTESADFFFR